MGDIKRIDIKEFRELGYLQELNRTFLHPLGLALEVVIDGYGEEILGGIWDSRDDKEGIYYNIKESTSDRLEKFQKNFEYVDMERKLRSTDRLDALDFVIEPIKNKYL